MFSGLTVKPCDIKVTRDEAYTQIQWPTLPHEYNYTVYWCVKDKEFLNEQRCQYNVSSIGTSIIYLPTINLQY